MKKLDIQSANFNYLLKEFSSWLDTIGYATGTVDSFPVHVREFLHFLETHKKLTHISGVKSRYVDDFLWYLKRRKNQTRGGSLSASHINKTTVAINSFARFLTLSGHYLIDITLEQMEPDYAERVILSREEIQALYEASFEPARINPIAIGQRDRAILAVFYACGLRKDEGTQLNLGDIDLIKKLIFVKKGKGGRQRYVPIASRSVEDLRAYITEGRYWFLENHAQSGYDMRYYRVPPKKHNTDDSALFLNQEGKRLGAFYQRLKILKERAGIEKEFGIHSLRHSIATHLLQSGMEIEEIAKFLGHSSLESTQIYTHIVNQLNIANNEDIELPSADEAFL